MDQHELFLRWGLNHQLVCEGLGLPDHEDVLEVDHDVVLQVDHDDDYYDDDDDTTFWHILRSIL